MNKKHDEVVFKTNDVNWMDKRKSELSAEGLDERVILRIYRFCKRHYEFILGFFGLFNYCSGDC
jgi:hypothetical protein